MRVVVLSRLSFDGFCGIILSVKLVYIKTQNSFMKKYIFGLAIVWALTSCDSKEKAVLKNQIDSLNVQLNIRKDAEKNLDDVGVLIDSIDESRKSLQVSMVEGTTYADYVGRLKNINLYIQKTSVRLAELEKSSKVSNSSIRRLKADLAKRSEEILELQLKLAREHDQNIALWAKLNSKDSLLSIKDEVIKVSEMEIAALEKLFNDTQEDTRIVVANLYYAQAQALETAANRTHFAPRKKKETRREALELYKLSLSLGKMEAQTKIDELEKKLS
jgi:hypothetical protein